MDEERTVQDVIDEMSEKQKTYFDAALNRVIHRKITPGVKVSIEETEHILNEEQKKVLYYIVGCHFGEKKKK